MRRLNFLLIMVLMAGGILLADSSANSSISSLTFQGSGDISASFTGSESTLQMDWSNPDTPYGHRRDIFIADGNYSGTQSANGLTVNRKVTVDEGSAQFMQSYFGEEDYARSFGSFVGCDQEGFLWGSGFSSEAFAYSDYSLGHYAGESSSSGTINTGFNVYSLIGDGCGYSQMSVNLFEGSTASQLNIIDWTEEESEDDSVSVRNKITLEEGFEMKILFRSTTSRLYI